MTVAEPRASHSTMSGPPARRPSVAEIRRAAAVGIAGIQLDLDRVPGVVLADVQIHDDEGAWMPDGHVVVRVWGGKGSAVWYAIQSSGLARGRSLALAVDPATRWARARAWWRWQMHRISRTKGSARRG